MCAVVHCVTGWSLDSLGLHRCSCVEGTMVTINVTCGLTSRYYVKDINVGIPICNIAIRPGNHSKSLCLTLSKGIMWHHVIYMYILSFCYKMAAAVNALWSASIGSQSLIRLDQSHPAVVSMKPIFSWKFLPMLKQSSLLRCMKTLCINKLLWLFLGWTFSVIQ